MTNAISQPYGCPPTWARVLRTIAVVLLWLPLIVSSIPSVLLCYWFRQDIIVIYEWEGILSVICSVLGWGLLCAAGSDWIVRIGTIMMILCEIGIYGLLSHVHFAYSAYSWVLELFIGLYGISLLVRHPLMERRKRVWCLLLAAIPIAARINGTILSLIHSSDYYEISWLWDDASSLIGCVRYLGTIFLMIAYWKIAHSPLFAGPQEPRKLGFRDFNPFNRVFFGAIAAAVLGIGILYLYWIGLAEAINWIFEDIWF